MYIQYDEFQLLELFGSEPVLIVDEEAGIFMYSKGDYAGFKLILTISIYENECNLSLIHEKYPVPIFESKLKDVEKISGTSSELKIERRGSNKVISLRVKPNFSIRIENL